MGIINLVFFTSCKQGVDGNKVIYEYEEESVELNAELKGKIGDWIEEGVVCYGCVVALDENKRPTDGKPVKSKVIQIKSDGVKLKALQSVSVGIGEQHGCTKMGITRGDTWWETEGDIFKTEEEAEAYLKQNGLLK